MPVPPGAVSLPIDIPRGTPVVAAWGMGVDSTAMIIEWIARGLPLSVVLTADTGTERDETYAFAPIFQRWMDAHHIEHHVVRYVPQRFKHWPPYFTLLENCLTNATLPSISIAARRNGRSSRRTNGSNNGRQPGQSGRAGARLPSSSAMTARLRTVGAIPTGKVMSVRSTTITIPCGPGAGTGRTASTASAPRACLFRSSRPVGCARRRRSKN